MKRKKMMLLALPAVCLVGAAVEQFAVRRIFEFDLSTGATRMRYAVVGLTVSTRERLPPAYALTSKHVWIEEGRSTLLGPTRTSHDFGGFYLRDLQWLLDSGTSLDDASKRAILGHMAIVRYMERDAPSDDYELMPTKDGLLNIFKDKVYEATASSIRRLDGVTVR